MGEPTRIEKIQRYGWVVRSALDGRILMGPYMARVDARVAAKEYRLNGKAMKSLPLTNKSITRR